MKKGDKTMSKRSIILTLSVLFVIASFGFVAHGVAGTTLTTQEMEAKRGSSDWGYLCTCGFDTDCQHCNDMNALHPGEGQTTYDYCTGTNEIFMWKIKWRLTSCDCAREIVDCDDYVECQDPDCSEYQYCTITSTCGKGCDQYEEDCDECDPPPE
jgi:hypothetical protein